MIEMILIEEFSVESNVVLRSSDLNPTTTSTPQVAQYIRPKVTVNKCVGIIRTRVFSQIAKVISNRYLGI